MDDVRGDFLGPPHGIVVIGTIIEISPFLSLRGELKFLRGEFVRLFLLGEFLFQFVE